MPYQAPPILQVVHRLPGRVRLRLFWLHDHPEAASPIVDRLSRLDGMRAVQVRRYTGSVLCEYDPDEIIEERVVEAVHECVGGIVQRQGEAAPEEVADLQREAFEEGADVARAVAAFVKGLDAQVLKLTEGRADVGTVAAVAFVAAGAFEVLATGELPVPPWFQLAWWAFRTFTTIEQRTIAQTEHPLQRVTH